MLFWQLWVNTRITVSVILSVTKLIYIGWNQKFLSEIYYKYTNQYKVK